MMQVAYHCSFICKYITILIYIKKHISYQKLHFVSTKYSKMKSELNTKFDWKILIIIVAKRGHCVP